MLERRASTTAKLQALREAVRKFVDQQVEPLLGASEQAGAMSSELLDLIKSHGYNGLRISAEWGGQGLSFAEFCVVLEGFARLGPSMHFWIIDSLGMTLQRFGTSQQKDKYLRPYAEWTKKGSLGFTEPDGDRTLPRFARGLFAMMAVGLSTAGSTFVPEATKPTLS